MAIPEAILRLGTNLRITLTSSPRWSSQTAGSQHAIVMLVPGQRQARRPCPGSGECTHVIHPDSSVPGFRSRPGSVKSWVFEY